MSPLALALFIASLSLLILCSAFFSGSETALFSLGNPTLTRWRKSGTRLQKLAAQLMKDHHGTLIAILLANNFVNILMAMLSKRLTDQYIIGPLAPIIAAIATTGVVLIFGEVAPKTIAYNASHTLAPRIAPVIHACYTLFNRLRLIALLRITSNAILQVLGKEQKPPAVSAEEYETFVRMGRAIGIFGQDEAELLEQILGLRAISASQAMRPRVDVQAADITLDDKQLMARIAECRHRLLPVVDGDLDKVIGVLVVKDFVLGTAAARTDWRHACVRKPLFVPELSTLTKVLELMRQEHQRMAFVVDEYGGVEGILTLEDIFEEIIGEMEDEYDQPAWHLTKLGDRHWRLSGSLPLHQLEDDLDIELPETIADTVSGLVIHQLEELPTRGDTWDSGAWRFIVRHVHRHRIIDLDLMHRPEAIARPHPEEED